MEKKSMYIVTALRRAAQLRPDHLATVFKDRTRTYGQVLDRVARLAGVERRGTSGLGA